MSKLLEISVSLYFLISYVLALIYLLHHEQLTGMLGVFISGTTSNTGSSIQFNSSILHEGADKDNIHVLAARALNISGKVPLTDKKLIIQLSIPITNSKQENKEYKVTFDAAESSPWSIAEAICLSNHAELLLTTVSSITNDCIPMLMPYIQERIQSNIIESDSKSVENEEISAQTTATAEGIASGEESPESPLLSSTLLSSTPPSSFSSSSSSSSGSSVSEEQSRDISTVDDSAIPVDAIADSSPSEVEDSEGSLDPEGSSGIGSVSAIQMPPHEGSSSDGIADSSSPPTAADEDSEEEPPAPDDGDGDAAGSDIATSVVEEDLPLNGEAELEGPNAESTALKQEP